MFKREIAEVVMDNITLDKVIGIAEKAGYVKGWWSGAMFVGGIWLVNSIFSNRQEQKTRHEHTEDDEI